MVEYLPAAKKKYRRKNGASYEFHDDDAAMLCRMTYQFVDISIIIVIATD